MQSKGNNIQAVDEAHIAKKVEMATQITLRWLNAVFTIMQSATPTTNHQRDMAGFVAMIEVPALWGLANLQKLNGGTYLNFLYYT